MHIVYYLINQSPSISLNENCLKKAWIKRDASFKHLSIFGCKAFVRMPKGQRTKLDNKSRPYIFLGYRSKEFGYRLWDLEVKKQVKSQDVIFFKNQTIEDFEKVEKTQASGGEFVDLRPISPSMIHDEGGDVQESQGEVLHKNPPFELVMTKESQIGRAHV